MDLVDQIRELRQAQARDLRHLARLERSHPLAFQTLWVAPAAGCDQRRAVIGAMTSDVAVVLGGWRSGKSAGLKQLNVAAAMGSDHPAVRAWLELNDLPRFEIPDGPQQTYLIAQSSGDSIRYHRDDIDRLVGSAGTWYNRNGKGEALLTISRPCCRALGKIWFKSVDQGRRAMQGISIRRADIDEEPLGVDGYGVFDELRARVADQGGKIGIAMVPMEGITWVHDRLVSAGEFGAKPFELDSLDNPHLPRTFETLFQGMSDDELAQRRFGKFRSRTGAVYPWVAGTGDRWGPGHLCEDFDIPPDWPRFRGADFGLVNATCVLWGALGDDDTLYIYREYYERDGKSYGWHAEQVAALEEPGEPIEFSWGDPAAREARDEFAEADLDFANADNDVKGGIDRVRDRMRLRGDNRPRLKVFRSCSNLVRELPALSWDPKRRDEVPIKRDDHAPDALRYLVQGVDAWSSM
jgi:hypothetical protein